MRLLLPVLSLALCFLAGCTSVQQKAITDRLVRDGKRILDAELTQAERKAGL